LTCANIPPPPATPLTIVLSFLKPRRHVHPLPPPLYMNTTEEDALVLPLPAAAAGMARTPCQTAAVKEIMSKVISLQSTTKYAGQNATFAIFCYHSIELRDDLLEPWFIEEVSLQTTEFAKQRHAKNCCVKMSPQDDNCPFILSNLTFEQFSNFVTQRKARRGKGRGLLICPLAMHPTSSCRVLSSISSA